MGDLEKDTETTYVCLGTSEQGQGNRRSEGLTVVLGYFHLVRWVKYGKNMNSFILGKDILVLSQGNFITFLDSSRPDRKDYLYNANSEVRGDGIQCMCVHKTLPCLAIAEKCRNPRILVISYPSFEVFKNFESVTDTNYIAIKFSEMEYLIALTGIPDFKLVIWNWRTAEKMHSQETKLEKPNQTLYVSPTSPIQIVQTTSTDRDIVFWDMHVCYKKTLLNCTPVNLPNTSRPPYSFCFGGDGEFYFVDKRGNLFLVNSDTKTSTMQYLPQDSEDNLSNPCMVWYKGGIVYSRGPEIYFVRRRSPDGWAKVWSFTPQTPVNRLLSSYAKDLLVGISALNEVFIVKGEQNVECVTIRTYGGDFEFICFFYPVGDFFLTYGNEKKWFFVWNKVNGQKLAHFLWTREKIRALEHNPKWPYIAASTENGKVYLLNTYDHTQLMVMREIALTRRSLNAMRFQRLGQQFCVANTDVGEFFLLGLPDNLEVLGYVKLDLKIADFGLVDRTGETYLFIMPVSQLCCRSGHTLLLYILDDRLKVFEHVRDVVMPSVTTSILVSPFSQKDVFCLAHRSRHLYIMNVTQGKKTLERVTGHQMKVISMKLEGEYLFTYGVDGLVVAKVADTKNCYTVFAPHHRLAKGIKKIAVGPYLQYVIALGEDGTLVGTLIKKTVKPGKQRAENKALMSSVTYKELFLNPLMEAKSRTRALDKFGLQDAGEQMTVSWYWHPSATSEFEEKVWLDLREEEKIKMEDREYAREKASITDELTLLKSKLRHLLDENYSTVPERQLPVQAFDLDRAGRRKKLEDGKAEREKEKQFQLAANKNLNKITDIIKKICWDSIPVKGREIHGIMCSLAVQSYSLLPEKVTQEALTWLQERLKIETFFHKGDFFEPWVPRTDSVLEEHINNKFQVNMMDVMQTLKTKFEEEHMEDEKDKEDQEEDIQTYVWSGTSSHNFIQVNPNHYNQFELTTFLQGHQEIQLIEVDIRKLMVWFNKEFAETFALKEREMAFLLERNSRFRHIINELSFFHFSPTICQTRIYDPVWVPQENPETIMNVDDLEIKAPIYISDSQMNLLKKKEAEEERLRFLKKADNFREKALMVMMDGVLEKLWEDEIKKDVPKPRCLLENKEPENWTEDDLRALKAYEEAVKFLASERERYRKMLEAEWSKILALVKDSVTKFDEKVSKLYMIKLKVEAAIGQEILKCLRIRERCHERIVIKTKKETVTARLLKNEKKIESMTAELSKLTEILNECRNAYEVLHNKDKNLDKNFKKEFPEYTPVVCEQLYKLSKKRPKLLQKAVLYSTVLNDVGKCAVSGSKPAYMPMECIQYLKDIDALDAPSNAPAAVTQQSWDLACKLRRAKIDCELKIRACAVDLADAEAAVSNYQKALKATKEYQTQLQNELQAIRMEKLNAALNYQVQLVLKKGLVEIPLTGHLSDFDECALVTTAILNEVNTAIEKMGLQKIKAMERAANFRKGIIYKEWEHKKLRMEIEDLKRQLDTVEKIQVLKELQAILVARARGFSDEKGFLFLENELSKVKEKYEESQKKIMKQIDELNMKMHKINLKNEELDERIVELNVEVNEMNLERDKDFDKKNLADHMKKMKKVRERSHLVRTIQEQHNEIMVLQTELELLRLKTYPTIKYKISY